MRSAWSNDSSVTKERFRGLAKNASPMVTLIAHSNLWMAHRSLLAGAGGSACSTDDDGRGVLAAAKNTRMSG